MPDEKKITPATPTAPAATAKATPATPAVTAPKAKAAATPKTERPTAPVVLPERKQRPTITAKKALGLEEEPNKEATKVVKTQQAKFQARNPDNGQFTKPAEEEPKKTSVAQEQGEAVEIPEEDAAPEVAPAAPASAPAAPLKVKIGDKEYTAEELQAEHQRLQDELSRAKATQQQSAPAPAQDEPAPQGPPAPTAEEIAQREAEFINATAPTLDAVLTEEQMDTLLTGGQEAVKLFTHLRQQDMARAVLVARKGIAEQVNPIIKALSEQIRPLAEQHQNLQVYHTEQHFVSKHKDFAPHVQTARSVATELWKRFPEQVSRMTLDQFVDEVARQTDTILTNQYKQWFPTGNGDWRAATRAMQAPAAPPAPAVVTPTPAPVPAAAPAPQPAPRAAVRAPASNGPAGTPTGLTVPWQRGVAHSLRP